MQAESKPIWGKLVPLSRGMSTYALKEKTIVIGRNADCHIVITQKRLSGKHCLIQIEETQIFITDTSTNGTYLNSEKIGKSNRIEIKNQTQIWLLPILRVPQEQTIGFKIVLLGDFLKDYNRAHASEVQEESRDKNTTFIKSLKEQITCCFCSEIMIFPVSIQPCNHRLCGPCLTELVLKKKDECIICRRKMETAARDASFNAIIDDYLRSHPEEIRKDEDDAPNIFGHQPKNIKMIINGNEGQEPQKKVEIPLEITQHEDKELIEGIQIMEVEAMEEQKSKMDKTTAQKKETKRQPRTIRKSKRVNRFLSSDISASTDSQPQIGQSAPRTIICKECSEQRKGFQCESGQVHINCHNCSKPFAKRDEDKLNQSCALCRAFFCNLYLPPCQKNGPKLILLGNRGPTCLIQPLFFRNNKVEMDAFKNLLVSEKKKVGDMFNEMLQLAQAGRFEFNYDKRIMRSHPSVQKTVRIHKRSPICDNCWRQLWFQMIFMFVQQYGYLMPETIKNRPPCYWGINCRTMQHSIEHAKKYNHMLYQSKF